MQNPGRGISMPFGCVCLAVAPNDIEGWWTSHSYSGGKEDIFVVNYLDTE